MTDSGSPRLRASDDDRNRIAAALSEAFARGQLSYEEFEERTQRVWAARHRDELLTPVSDLMSNPARVLEQRMSPHTGTVPTPRAGAGTARQQVTGEVGGRALSFAALGLSERRGDWLISPTHVSLSVLGSTVIDLRHVRLASEETVITAFGVLGAVEILVPEDVLVVGEGYGILGAFEITRDRRVTVSQRDLPAGSPVVRIRGLGLLGSVSIRLLPRKSGD